MNMSYYADIFPTVVISVYVLSAYMIYFIKSKKIHLEETDRHRNGSFLLAGTIKLGFIWILSPIENFLKRNSIHPNTVTLFSIPLSLLAGASAALGFISTAGWFLVATGMCDILDGRLARATGNHSSKGMALDSILDRYAEGFFFLGLAYYYKDHFLFFFVWFGLIGSFMVSYIRAKGESLGISITNGLMQRPERLAALSIACILGTLINPFIEKMDDMSKPQYPMLMVTLMVLAVLANYTGITRLKTLLDSLEKRDAEKQ